MNITKQTILYLGISVAICVVLYLVLRGRVVEGLSNTGAMSEIIAKGFDNDLKQLEDTLLIEKYGANYRTILDDMSKWADLAILNGLMTGGKLNVQNGVDETNTQVITSLNQYAELKKTLQGVKKDLLSN
jgi:hypothetical protein